MNPFTVIIPSKNHINLQACLTAIREAGETCQVIVVDDGVDFNEWECVGPVSLDLHRRGARLVTGVQPFIFARNVNRGILHAGTDDVILLNDDALLETPGGFTALQQASTAVCDMGVGLSGLKNIGLISATTNLAGNSEQQQHGPIGMRICPSPTPGNSFATVAFVCVYIPRWTINAVGHLDERFTAYGWEDNDYCRRLANAGLKIGICDGCFVNHARLHSTFRGEAYAAGDINAGRQIYLDKWGSM